MAPNPVVSERTSTSNMERFTRRSNGSRRRRVTVSRVRARSTTARVTGEAEGGKADGDVDDLQEQAEDHRLDGLLPQFPADRRADALGAQDLRPAELLGKTPLHRRHPFFAER